MNKAIHDAIFELADLIANPGGYAADAEESDQRAAKRDELARELREWVAARV